MVVDHENSLAFGDGHSIVVLILVPVAEGRRSSISPKRSA